MATVIDFKAKRAEILAKRERISRVIAEDVDMFACEDCAHVQELCQAAYPGHNEPGVRGRLFCTRPEGHSGPHRACGLGREDHPIHEWRNDA